MEMETSVEMKVKVWEVQEMLLYKEIIIKQCTSESSLLNLTAESTTVSGSTDFICRHKVTFP